MTEATTTLTRAGVSYPFTIGSASVILMPVTDRLVLFAASSNRSEAPVTGAAGLRVRWPAPHFGPPSQMGRVPVEFA